MNETITEDDRNLAETITAEIFLIFVCIFAVGGNSCMWIIIYRTRKLRTISNAFILSLNSADLLVSVLNMPPTAIAIAIGRWPFSEQVCQVFGFFNMFTLVQSVLSLCNISINRYVIVCRPFKFQSIYTINRSALMIAGTYIILSLLVYVFVFCFLFVFLSIQEISNVKFSL
jgi:cholecystokinin B receptor